MKISLEWIRELLPIYWTPEETMEKLAELGFPVESVEKSGIQIDNVISVKIKNIDKHPNADRLQIATVYDGHQDRSIVCGATNIAVGQVVPLALPGAKLPGGIEISISKIRGVESGGMLCSERELGLSQEHAGIFQLPTQSPLGKPLKELLGKNDVIFDVEITPNRPDLLSHIGLARELSATTDKRVKLPLFKASKASSTKKTISIQIDNKSKCEMYSGKIIKGINVGPAPEWIGARLKACGIRSINNVVDITNYVLLETGHPLHAFDLSKLQDHRIIVRNANDNEAFMALDGKKYTLTSKDLVIADSKKPVALAGVMGGQESGVTETTVDVLLESALFDRATVRETSQRHTLRSESSIRFEKGTNIDTASWASQRALGLILEICGGSLEAETIIGKGTSEKRTGTLDFRRIEKVLGASVPAAQVNKYLIKMGLSPKKSKSGWTCTIPSYRLDLLEDIDLIEEIARLEGYNKFPSTLPVVTVPPVPDSFIPKNCKPLLSYLKAAGVTETMTHSFSSLISVEDFGWKKENLLTLANPLSQEESILRPLLLNNLLNAVLLNQNHQAETISLFEVGKVFSRYSNPKNECLTLGLVLAGQRAPVTWNEAGEEWSIFDLKGLLEPWWELHPHSQKPYLHPYQSYDLSHRGKKVGWAGMIHPALLKKRGIKGPVAAAEVQLENLELVYKKGLAKPLRRFPFVDRDVAVILDKSKNWGDLLQQVKKIAGELYVDAFPFDLFEGGNLSGDQKSLAFRVRLQHPDRTLTDSEILTVIDKIKTTLKEHCGAQLR